MMSKDCDNTKDNLVDCRPIKSINDLQDFLSGPPEWIKSINNLVPRSSDVTKYNGTGRCHYHPIEPVYEKRYNRNYIPKTLVCHDFKNGYLQDRFVNGCKNEDNGYVFDKWSHIDIFIYFSHHLVTIPPLGWINLAHEHGVKILGTFITEWDEGKAFWNAIIDDNLSENDIEKNIIKLADDLARLMYLIKIDGWLINIENPISKPEYVLLFVKHLSRSSHKENPGCLIIWYDSVTESGELKWQNELNSKNRCYFDVCDGIFLNYNWTPEGLRRSAVVAEHRHLDVYAGVDVFGRGCYGNGRFHSYLAARETREANVSMAIFAPGWTYETMAPVEGTNRQEAIIECFLHRDNAFWRSLGPFLYTHPINHVFFTTLHTGVNTQTFDLSKQDIILHRIPHSKLPAHEEELNVETLLRWRCNCVQLQANHASGRTVVELVGGENCVHRLLACDIPLVTRSSDQLVLIAIIERLPGDDNTWLKILLTIEDYRNGCFRRVVFVGKQKENCNGDESATSFTHDKSVLEVSCPEQYMSRVLNAYPSLQLPQYKFNVYNLDLDYGKIVNLSMEVMNGSKLLLHAFGIIDSNMFHIKE